MYSYGMNIQNYSSWGGQDYRGAKTNQVVNPSAKLDFVDALDWQVPMSNSVYATFYAQRGEYYEWPAYCAVTAYRHMQGANVVFFDGHVAGLKYQTLQNNSAIWSLW